MSAIRDATVDDLATIVALDAACFADPWPASAWRGELEPGYGQSLVLLADLDRGFACAPLLDERCELRRIAVVPAHRGHGLARDLLIHVIERARTAGCDRIELEVAEQNVAALALYRRAGFSLVGRRPGYYRSPPSDALLLNLSLGRKPIKSSV